MPLLIREGDVTRAISLKDVIEAVEDGFRQHGLGLAQTLARREVRIRGKELPHADPRMVRVGQGLALLEQSGVVLIQHLLSFPDRRTPPIRIIKHLIDADSGNVIAIIDSMNISEMRTGAAGALGAKFLSRKDSSVAGMIGTGRQGRIQLHSLLQVRPIAKAYAYSRNPARTEKFCEEMSGELGIDVFPGESIEKVVKEADVLVTATFSMSPIVKAEWLSPGLHVNIIGADDLPKIELEGAALKRADKLVIAAEEDCFRTGQMRVPMEEGIISRKDIYGTIGEIIAGIKPGRETESEVTIFHSPGVNLQDAAAAYKLYLRAKELGLGVNVPDPFVLG